MPVRRRPRLTRLRAVACPAHERETHPHPAGGDHLPGSARVAARSDARSLESRDHRRPVAQAGESRIDVRPRRTPAGGRGSGGAAGWGGGSRRPAVGTPPIVHRLPTTAFRRANRSDGQEQADHDPYVPRCLPHLSVSAHSRLCLEVLALAAGTYPPARGGRRPQARPPRPPSGVVDARPAAAWRAPDASRPADHRSADHPGETDLGQSAPLAADRHDDVGGGDHGQVASVTETGRDRDVGPLDSPVRAIGPGQDPDDGAPGLHSRPGRRPPSRRMPRR